MENEMKRSRYALNLQHFAEGDPDPTPDPAPAAPEKTFTQAELDALIADRLGRERKKFADYDELKTKLTALEQAEAEREAAKLTETERLQAEKDAAEKKAQEAEGKGAAALAAANQRLINAEFKVLAREKNVPAERLAAALKLADLTGASVDDEGNVAGVKEAVEALIAENAYLVAEVKPGSRQVGGDTNGGSRRVDVSTLGARDKMALGYSSTGK
ncbi:scaffolding protein [Paenibacillus tengchongensis]|uniref:phage scaffolding protein n=1 Tax=Paenibacillus tengchongensis TaxID=2608684 RepID=UPI00124E9EEF|nr:scaffolding protein [Paenibacillus tengchongensis]